MKKWCESLGLFVLIAGIIGSFIVAYQNGVDVSVSSYSYRIIEERNWITTIAWFCGSCFSTIILFTIIMSLCDILKNQEMILSKMKEADAPLLQRHLEEDKNYWKCPQCGSMNHNSATTCSCGYSK